MTASSPGASPRAIAQHYDAGNDFYALWLDPGMTYSCALWREGDDLEQAQMRKLDHHIHRSGAAGAARVLDIGCGWGGLLRRLTAGHGVAEAVGLTLSPAQAAFIEKGPHPKLAVKLQSWREHRPERPYDAMISIGSFEHFARPETTSEERIAGYRRFFAFCHRNLLPGGGLSLQTIGRGNMLPEDFSSFFAEEIFPESFLPSLAEIAAAAEHLFAVESLRNDPLDYGKTLRAWHANLKRNHERAVALAGEERVANYERYFKLAIVAFEVLGSMALYRIAFKRIDKPRVSPGA